METAFGWLGDVFRFLLSLVPRIEIVRATHAGVKFKRGRDVVYLGPDNGIAFPIIKWVLCFPVPWLRRTGLHFYWPLVTEVEVVPIKRQTKDLDPQYLTTADNRIVGVCGILVYEVDDVVKLLTECYDYDETIRDHAVAAIKQVVCEYDAEFLQNSEVDEELTKQLREMLEQFGVATIKVTLSNFARCRVHAHWGFGSSRPIETE